MSELLEPFEMGLVHVADECPLCPKSDNTQHYVTYSGEDNSGSKLAKNINNPEGFGVSVEADARPKDGKTGKDDRLNQFFVEVEDEDKEDGLKGKDKGWKFQAHHAISGNQCLAGHPVERYILGKKDVRFDTGYSVNNPQNGVWLPSGHKRRAWPGVANYEKSLEIAMEGMEQCGRQFHVGGHDIAVDANGLDPKCAQNYIDFVQSYLTELHGILIEWSAHCPNAKKEKPIGNTIIHNALDAVSGHIIGMLTSSPRRWTSFVSRYSRDYLRELRKKR